MAEQMTEMQKLEELVNGMTLEWLDPHSLQPYAGNPKRHTTVQRQSFEDFVGDVGWVGAGLYNKRTKHLLDGHMRQQYALENNMNSMPVLVIDVPEEKEPEIVSMLDTVGRLYQINRNMLSDLASRMQTQSDTLRLLLDRTQSSGEVDIDHDPEEDITLDGQPPDAIDIAGDPLPPGGLSMVLGEQYNYIVLLFRSSFDWMAAQDHFGIVRQRCAFHNTQVGVGRVIDGGAYLNKLLKDRKKKEAAINGSTASD